MAMLPSTRPTSMKLERGKGGRWRHGRHHQQQRPDQPWCAGIWATALLPRWTMAAWSLSSTAGSRSSRGVLGFGPRQCCRSGRRRHCCRHQQWRPDRPWCTGIWAGQCCCGPAGWRNSCFEKCTFWCHLAPSPPALGGDKCSGVSRARLGRLTRQCLVRQGAVN